MTKMKSIICFMVVFLGACTSLKYASTMKSKTASSNTERKLASSYIHPKYKEWCKKKWGKYTESIDDTQPIEDRIYKAVTQPIDYKQRLTDLRRAYNKHSCDTEPFAKGSEFRVSDDCSFMRDSIKHARYFSKFSKKQSSFYDYCPFLYVDKDLCNEEVFNGTQRCDGCQEIDPAKITDPVCCRAHGYTVVPNSNFGESATKGTYLSAFSAMGSCEGSLPLP